MATSAASGVTFDHDVLEKLQHAATILKKGGVIVCPTEGVYGISCLASNEEAIKRIIEIKKRALNKGLIVVAASASEVGLVEDKVLEDVAAPNEGKENLGPAHDWADLDKISNECVLKLLSRWPGHLTAIIPVSKMVSATLTGGRDTLALRVTAYPLLAKLCELAGEPIVSTSANISGSEPLGTISELKDTFLDKVDYILEEPCQGLNKPSTIIDALSGKVLRE